MLNHIVLMGRLTRDPELRHTNQNSVPVAAFTIAVDRDWSGRDNEKQTDFIDIVAWRSTAEFVSKYFTKGKMIVVSGKLHIRDWTDKEGSKRRSAEVVADNVYFGESKRNDQPQYGSYPQPSASGGYSSGGGDYSGGGYSGGGYSPGASYSGHDSASQDTGFTTLDDDGELPF